MPIDRNRALGSNHAMAAVDGIGGTVAAPLKGALAAVLDLLLPHQCLKCGAVIGDAGALCTECWAAIAFIAPPLCGRCGYPFDLEVGGGDEDVCGACLRDPPPWDRGRAVFRYDEASRPLIVGFKHGDRTQGAPAFGAWLARAAGPLAEEADIVAPVPLHRVRLFRRRYNQAALLAGALARETERVCLPDLLERTRATPSQGRLSRTGRRRNVRGAFAVPARHRPRIADRRILLVDDVLTTGATMEAAARCLLRAGARAVDVLALARVVRPLA